MFQRFVFIHNCDVTDAVNLMESLNAMFYEFSKFHGTVDSVGNTLDDDLFSTIGFEQVVSTLKVTANSDLVLDSDFVRGKALNGFINSSVLV